MTTASVDNDAELPKEAQERLVSGDEHLQPWKKSVASFRKLLAATVPLSEEINKPNKRRKSVEPSQKYFPVQNTAATNTTSMDPKELLELLETERLKRQAERWNAEEEITSLQDKIISLEKCLEEMSNGITDFNGNEELILSLLERIHDLEEEHGGQKLCHNSAAALKETQEKVINSLKQLRAAGMQLKSKYSASTVSSKVKKKRRHSWFDADSKTSCIEDLKQDLIKQAKEADTLSSKLQKSLMESKKFESKMDEMMLELKEEKQRAIEVESEKNLFEAKYNAEVEKNALFKSEMEKLQLEIVKDENTVDAESVLGRVTTIETKLLKEQMAKLQEDFYALERQKNQALMQLEMESHAKESLAIRLKAAEEASEEQSKTIALLTEQLDEKNAASKVITVSAPPEVDDEVPSRHRRVQSAIDVSELQIELKDFMAGRGHC